MDFDSILEGKDAFQVRLHLTVCPHCRRLYNNLRSLHTLLAVSADEPQTAGQIYATDPLSLRPAN